MSSDRLRQLLVGASFIFAIVINGAANVLPINGQTTAEISDRFRVFVVPAGYVFSIWGLIYIGLIAYAVFQALPSQRENPRLRNTGYPVAISGLANIAWIFLWHYEHFPWTLIAMFSLLALLIVIYLRLGIGKTKGSTAETWTVQIPFSVYLGWITVATIANITDVLYFLNWDGFGISPEVWFLIVLAAVIVISGLISLTRRDIAYNLVILWALVAIAVKHSPVPLIMVTSLAAAVIVAAILVYSRLKPQAAIAQFFHNPRLLDEDHLRVVGQAVFQPVHPHALGRGGGVPLQQQRGRDVYGEQRRDRQPGFRPAARRGAVHAARWRADLPAWCR